VVDRDRRRAVLDVHRLAVIDSFQFFGPNDQAAQVHFSITWQAVGPSVRRGRGNAVPPDDPAAFRGQIAPARSVGRFGGAQLGFQFTSLPASNADAGPTTDRGYAQLGTERNGVFL